MATEKLEPTRRKLHKIEYSTPKSQVSAFEAEIGEHKIRIDVLRMKQSDLIWIGNKSTPTFSNLALAMQSRYESNPITNKLYGANDEALGIAARLSKMLGKQIFLSLNVPSDRIMAFGSLVEKVLCNIIENNKDCF